MIQLLLIISLIILIGSLVAYKEDCDEEICLGVGLVSGLILLVMSIVLPTLAVQVQGLDLIEEKLALRETRNAEIEAKVGFLVDKYMNYESTTFKELKPSEIMVAVELYPELKSDAMIQDEIKLYKDNIAEITSLKERKINGKVLRWWLYFGGEN